MSFEVTPEHEREAQASGAHFLLKKPFSRGVSEFFPDIQSEEAWWRKCTKREMLCWAEECRGSSAAVKHFM